MDSQNSLVIFFSFKFFFFFFLNFFIVKFDFIFFKLNKNFEEFRDYCYFLLIFDAKYIEKLMYIYLKPGDRFIKMGFLNL